MTSPFLTLKVISTVATTVEELGLKNTPSDTPRAVNMAHVISIEPSEGGCTLFLDVPRAGSVLHTLRVKESMEEVLRQLEQHQGSKQP